MNRISAARSVCASLAAMLRATSPSGRTLPLVGGLEHSRYCAVLALGTAAWQASHDADRGPRAALDAAIAALQALVDVTADGAAPVLALVSARVAAWPALTDLQADLVEGVACGVAGLTGAERAHHDAFLWHQQQVAERYWLRVQTDPTLRAADFARDNPFVAPAV